MAHFHVLVIGDDVAGQLARYDENKSVAPYKVRVTSENAKNLATWAALRGREAIPFDTVATSDGDTQFLARRVARWTECQTGIDLDGVYYMSRANPDGEWDWWSSCCGQARCSSRSAL